MVYFFYLCSCLSTQFLYRTAVKATFNVKDNIKDIIKNSITLTINITTFLTMFRKFRWQNHICSFLFPIATILHYSFNSVYNIRNFFYMILYIRYKARYLPCFYKYSIYLKLAASSSASTSTVCE